MKSDNSKLFLGLIVGVAVGAAVGCFLASGKKEEIFDEFGKTVDKARKKITKAVNEGIEELDGAVDKVNALAHSAISRAKAVSQHREEV